MGPGVAVQTVRRPEATPAPTGTASDDDPGAAGPDGRGRRSAAAASTAAVAALSGRSGRGGRLPATAEPRTAAAEIAATSRQWTRAKPLAVAAIESRRFRTRSMGTARGGPSISMRNAPQTTLRPAPTTTWTAA